MEVGGWNIGISTSPFVIHTRTFCVKSIIRRIVSTHVLKSLCSVCIGVPCAITEKRRENLKMIDKDKMKFSRWVRLFWRSKMKIITGCLSRIDLLVFSFFFSAELTNKFDLRGISKHHM